MESLGIAVLKFVIVATRERLTNQAGSFESRLTLVHQLIFLIPGDEYVSSCLWPLRSRCSIVEKSFLFTSSCLRNSDLEASVSFGEKQFEWRELDATYCAKARKWSLVSCQIIVRNLTVTHRAQLIPLASSELLSNTFGTARELLAANLTIVASSQIFLYQALLNIFLLL